MNNAQPVSNSSAKKVQLSSIVLDNVVFAPYVPSIQVPRNVNSIARKVLLVALKLAAREKQYAQTAERTVLLTMHSLDIRLSSNNNLLYCYSNLKQLLIVV